MFETLKRLLKSQSATSAEIREEIARLAETELPAARERLAAIRRKRETLLLEGTEKDRSAIRLEILKAEDELEALDVAHAALQKKLEAAEAEEHRAVLQAKVDQARKASDRGVDLLKRAAEIVPQLAAIAAELAAAEEVVRDSWAASKDLGVEKVAGPNARVRGAGGREYRFLEQQLVLPSITDSSVMLWPPSHPEGKAEVIAIRERIRAAS